MPFGLDLDPFRNQWNSNNLPLKWPARALGLVCAALLIYAEQTQSVRVNQWSKCAFLTGIVLLSLVVLNRDLKRMPAAWLLLLACLAFHISFVRLVWRHLLEWNFIILTLLAFSESLFLFLPVVLLRRWRRIEYPSSDTQHSQDVHNHE